MRNGLYLRMIEECTSEQTRFFLFFLLLKNNHSAGSMGFIQYKATVCRVLRVMIKPAFFFLSSSVLKKQ